MPRFAVETGHAGLDLLGCVVPHLAWRFPLWNRHVDHHPLADVLLLLLGQVLPSFGLFGAFGLLLLADILQRFAPIPFDAEV